MKLLHCVANCICLFLLVLSAVAGLPEAAFSQPVASPRYKQGELIVRFKDPARAAKTLAAHKAGSLKSYTGLKLEHVRLAPGTSVQEALAAYRNDPNVLYAEPNYRVKKAATPSDTQYASQWNLPLISAPSAWDRFTGNRDMVVAVLDTGVAYTHPDLAANLWTNPGEIPNNGIDDDHNGIIDDYYGANFGGTRGAGDPWDDDTADSHGTHLAGIVGAVGNNALGVSGVNWAVRVMAVKFLHGPDGSGDLSDVLKGIEYALSKQAKIINLSFEVDEDPTLINDIKSLREAIAAADQAGVLVVSAAGNSGSDLDNVNIYPASIRQPNNISVAAATRIDTLASYSGFGRHTVDLAAPGGATTGSSNAILSTVWLNNGTLQYRTLAGTSAAAPHVSGALALVWGSAPGLSHYQVKARILNGVDTLPSYASTISGGRLNLSRSFSIGELPAIFNVSPYRIPAAGGTVSISGVNFGATPGRLMLGALQLATSSWSDTAITAFIPGTAASGLLQVNGAGSGFQMAVGGPTVQLTAVPSSGVTPLNVTITSQISSTSAIVKYEWDSGDGVFQIRTSGTLSTSFSTAGNYLIRLRVTDSQGQTGIGSTTVTVSNPSSGGGDGGGCFIATAAYGSYLHPRVQLLRDFRDRFLLTNGPGRLLVRAYYAVSPPVAAVISRHEGLRVMSRAVLTPVVLAVAYPLPASALILALSGAALLLRRRLMQGRSVAK